MHTHTGSALHNPVTLTYHLWMSGLAYEGPAIGYMRTTFGVDSSSCFLERVPTYTHAHIHTVKDGTDQ